MHQDLQVGVAAALIYLPFLQPVFHTRALGLGDVLVLAAMAPIVWGADEVRRRRARRRTGSD